MHRNLYNIQRVMNVVPGMRMRKNQGHCSGGHCTSYTSTDAMPDGQVRTHEAGTVRFGKCNVEVDVRVGIFRLFHQYMQMLVHCALWQL